MTKALSLILGLLVLVQLIYPLGLPGLKRRADAWKIAVLALALILAIATLRPPHTEASTVGWIAAAPDRVNEGRAEEASGSLAQITDGSASRLVDGDRQKG